ncbi:hypothetical protein [Tessaracoccus antarcticus]|uniref:Uncharacterized protein n=1 Tax=Tessaracoccus antarcticus TaxID=2479848 RepID=A0A3M0GBG3_9ACTN|nr:hypothetical protein [Tessaracoccus antarcticus]RMB59902.1 hypothetical protein EAX62_09205 [Tessaracoccus antarcticus]
MTGVLVAVLWIAGGAGTVALFAAPPPKASLVIRLAMTIPYAAYLWGGAPMQELQWYWVLLFSAIIGDAILHHRRRATHRGAAPAAAGDRAQ